MISRFLEQAVFAIGSTLMPLSMAHAVVVDYVATSLGGNAWRYDYTVTNTTPSIGFDELTVYFDVGKYGQLSAAIAPTGWDPIAVQPDPGIPASGFYDVLSLSGHIGDDATVSGLSVTFAYLAAGSPGAQPFELLDAAGFAVVYAGMTTPASAVPEPERWLAMLFGVTFILASLRRRRSIIGKQARSGR